MQTNSILFHTPMFNPYLLEALAMGLEKKYKYK